MSASKGRILERVERQLARQRGPSRLGAGLGLRQALSPDGLERIVESYRPGHFPTELFGEDFD